jgi:hypothetical protein
MDPVTTLAASVSMVLGKYALKEGAQVTAEIGKEAMTLAAELLRTIRAHFEAQSGEKPQNALSNYEKDPEDYEAVFEKYLKQQLEANEVFRQEVATLLERFKAVAPEAEVNIVVSGSGAAATQGGVAAGEGGVAVDGDVEGGIHIGRSG